MSNKRQSLWKVTLGENVTSEYVFADTAQEAATLVEDNYNNFDDGDIKPIPRGDEGYEFATKVDMLFESGDYIN